MTNLPLLSDICRVLLRWWTKHVLPWMPGPWDTPQTYVTGKLLKAPRVLWDRLPYVPTAWRPR